MRTAGVTSVSALVNEGGAAKGLDALFTETARVAQTGFTATEFERAKQNLLRSFERAVAEKDKQNSAPLADELVRHFLTNEPIPGIVYEQQLYQRFLPEITLAELNALAKTWVPTTNRVVLVSAPEKAGLALPTQSELATAMNDAANTPMVLPATSPTETPRITGSENSPETASPEKRTPALARAKTGTMT